MYTNSPNASCFSNKSPMISKKSMLCAALGPGHSRRICTSGLCFESTEQYRAQDVAEPQKGPSPTKDAQRHGPGVLGSHHYRTGKASGSPML